MNEEKVKKLFRYQHLPLHLQEVSKPFYDLAVHLATSLQGSAEATLAIRKVWEAKNLAVWSAVETKETSNG